MLNGQGIERRRGADSGARLDRFVLAGRVGCAADAETTKREGNRQGRNSFAYAHLEPPFTMLCSSARRHAVTKMLIPDSDA